MNLSPVEREILNSFPDGNMMTLKMIVAEINKKNQNTSRQSIWYALQLLVARDMIKKVDRGVYRKA